MGRPQHIAVNTGQIRAAAQRHAQLQLFTQQFDHMGYAKCASNSEAILTSGETNRW